MLDMILDVSVIVLLTVGTFFCVVAAIGIVIMPDIFLRMSATTKAATVGAGFVLIAAALFFGLGDGGGVASRAIAVMLFLLLTAPVGAHMIGRAAYYEPGPNGEPSLWENTKMDELKDRFNEFNPQQTTQDKG
jgi:multicomponent Na+:H+ antiporter subunit G